MRSSDPTPEPGHPTLKAFQQLLHGVAFEEAAEALLGRLSAEGLAEAAFSLFKRHQPKGKAFNAPAWQELRNRLERAAEEAREKRIHQWPLDPNRRSLRLCMEVRKPASDLNPGALLHALNQVFLQAELPLAMGLEKRPRPATSLGPTLPLGVEGLCEWVDCALREPGRIPPQELPARLTAHCPPGLRILEARIIPNHSSTLLEIAEKASWRWDCPDDLLASARTRLEGFKGATSFEIEKTGKVDGKKGIKRIEVRHLVEELAWEGNSLCFSTRLQGGEAPSPLKLLAGILGVSTERIRGLMRLKVHLGKDPRLEQAHKYEPKLHNIYEDAVLLESSEDPQILEDDDDLLLWR
jgi:radical SAM-linked protein